MKIVYTPDDGDPQAFEFNSDDLRTVEAEDIEECGGNQWETFGEWGNKLFTGSFRAWRAALWILLRRQNPVLTFAEVAPRVGQLSFDADEDEPAAEVEPVGKDVPAAEATDSP